MAAGQRVARGVGADDCAGAVVVYRRSGFAAGGLLPVG